MKVVLDEYFSKYTNGFSEHEVEAVTVSEAMAVVCNRYPQLLVHLQWDNAKICETSGLRLDGEYLEGHDKVHETPVEPESVLELLRLPPVPEGEGGFFNRLFSFIAAALFIVAGVVGALMYAAFGMAALNYIGLIGNLAFFIIAVYFTPFAPAPQIAELKDSNTYTFDGVVNSTASGIPVSLIYGTHRVGGHVLNLYTETDNDPALVVSEDGREVSIQHTFLLVQLALGEGEIDSVTDVHINELPATFYNAIETVGFPGEEHFIRTGTKNQTPMPAFTEVRNSNVINRKVAVMQSPVTLPKPQYADLEPVYGYVTTNNQGKYEVVQKRVKYEVSYEPPQYEDYGNWG